MSRESAKAWKAKNPERARANRRKSYERNRDREIARAKEWYAANPWWRPSFVERNGRRLRDLMALRKSERTGAKAMFDPSDVRDAYGGRCWACGSAERIGMDHIVPLTRGGSNCAFNLRVLCGPCNARKHKRLDHEIADDEFRERLLLGHEAITLVRQTSAKEAQQA